MIATASGPNTPKGGSIDTSEIEKFERLAADWWNPRGSMKPLHKFNPVRLGYIREKVLAHRALPRESLKPLQGLSVLDIGCGGGILCEPLARLGGKVTGIDPAPGNIEVAKRHAASVGLAIDYRASTIEELVAAGERFDLVLCMEVVEHVADVPSFVGQVCRAVAPGGLLVMATLNRTLKSFALAIVGAEYVLRWLPVGTHDWQKFVTPRELEEAIETAELEVFDRTGVAYNPLADVWRLARDMDVNYMLSARWRP